MSITGAFIKEIIVDNYKSLRDSKIEFQKGLNIIIGKNGAGKSNLLEFINKYIRRESFTSIRPNRLINTNFFVSIAYTNDKKKHEISLTLERLRKSDVNFQDLAYTYEITIDRKVGTEKVLESKRYSIPEPKQKKEIREELKVFSHLFKRFITFDLPQNLPWLSTPARFTVDIDNTVNVEQFDSSFSFFFEIEFDLEFRLFDSLSEKERSNNLLLKKGINNHLKKFISKSQINDALQKYTPIQEIRFSPNINIYSTDQVTIVENLSLEFLIESDWVPWSYLSDGTKRLFFLVSECLSINEGVILVEEPELGVHPHQLLKVIEFLKDQSKKKQVIITTHSPLALDILQESELNRINIAKYEKGTRFYKLNTAQVRTAKRYMREIGELSYYWIHSDLEND
jgi:AAA15 family ATPase/GTPase